MDQIPRTTSLVRTDVTEEKRRQLIRVLVSASVEGFIGAVLLKKFEGFEHELALAMPAMIGNSAQESMARKQDRFNAMVDASSEMDADQKTKLKTLFIENKENKLKSLEAEDKGREKGLIRQKGSLCLPLHSLDDIDSDNTLAPAPS